MENCDPCLRFDQDDLIRLSKEVVAFSKFVDGYPCKSLTSFAFIDNWDDIDTDTFGESVLLDSSRDYVFLRSRTQQFPALIITPDPTISIQKGFQNVQYEEVTYEVMIVDDVDVEQLGCPDSSDGSKDCSKCDKRNLDQVKTDLKNMWLSWARYINDTKYYSYEAGGETFSGYYNRGRIVFKEGMNEIENVKESYPMSKQLLSDLRQFNADYNLTYNYIGKLLAVVGKIKIKTIHNCTDTEYSYDNSFNNKLTLECPC